MDEWCCVFLLMLSLILCVTHAHMFSSCASYRKEHDIPHKSVTGDNGAPNLRVAMERSGSDVILKCRARGTPRPAIYWYRNDKPAVFPNKHHVVLRNAKPKSSAVYICQTINKYGELNWTFVINVTVLQEDDGSISTERKNNPFYIRKRTMLLLGIGGSLHCRCLVKHDKPDIVDPPLQRTRTRRKQVAADGQIALDEEYLNVHQVQTASKLSLSHVTRSAIGVFVCERQSNHVAYRKQSLALAPDGGENEAGGPLNDRPTDPDSEIDLAMRLGTTFKNPEKVEETEDANEVLINSSHRVYVKGVVWSVVMSFTIVMAGCCCLVGFGVRKAWKTDEMISEKIDLT